MNTTTSEELCCSSDDTAKSQTNIIIAGYPRKPTDLTSFLQKQGITTLVAVRLLPYPESSEQSGKLVTACYKAKIKYVCVEALCDRHQRGSEHFQQILEAKLSRLLLVLQRLEPFCLHVDATIGDTLEVLLDCLQGAGVLKKGCVGQWLNVRDKSL